MNTIKLMLVDDHQMFIDGMRSMLRQAPDIEIAATANSGMEALQSLAAQPEINFVITDINMPEMSGTELTKTIKQQQPDTKVLVLSMFNEQAIINEILLAEAEGYILKNTGKAELINAITHIQDGGTFYSHAVVDLMLQQQRAQQRPTSPLQVLSKRELEILELVCEEMSTNEIAEQLYISPRTVETHRKNIMTKTASKTLVGLIKFAIANQLVVV